MDLPPPPRFLHLCYCRIIFSQLFLGGGEFFFHKILLCYVPLMQVGFFFVLILFKLQKGTPIQQGPQENLECQLRIWDPTFMGVFPIENLTLYNYTRE